MACILVNTVVLAMDYDGIQGTSLESSLEDVNLVLTFVFMAEMIITIPAVGPKAYFTDAPSVFDCIIVITSIIELVAGMGVTEEQKENGEGGGGGLSAFRTFRLFRVFKMAKEWKSLQVLLKTMLKTILEIGNFAVLLLLFMFIYALIGMQFFSNRMRFYDSGEAIPITDRENWEGAWEGSPRNHFDDFLWAMTTIFQVLTGEDWNACMYDAWRGTGWGAVVYFLSLVVLGAFIVMNLFLAILLGNFEGNDELVGAGGAAKDEGLGSNKYEALSSDISTKKLASAALMGDKWKRKSVTNSEENEKEIEMEKKDQDKAKAEQEEKEKAKAEAKALEEELSEDRTPPYKALYVFDEANPIRQRCTAIAENKDFEKVSERALRKTSIRATTKLTLLLFHSIRCATFFARRRS